MSRVLVVCADVAGSSMAGPAIRCWEMARVLAAAGNEVHLSVPQKNDLEPTEFKLVVSSPASLTAEERWADVIIVQGMVLASNPQLARTGKFLVVDLYDPITLEVLEMFADDAIEDRLSQHWSSLAALIVQSRIGDFFLCASEKQRDFWLGFLLSADRVNPYTHGDDKLLRRLIDIAPFGIGSQPPTHSGKPAAKGVLPGIGVDDRLAIWAGGVYNWFDPLSLIRAWPQVLDRVPSARLLFLGIQHPNPGVPRMAMAARAVKLAEDLGLRDAGVTFNMTWVPYEHRKDFLLESELGVSMHFNHIETRFSFRTRVLDYIWAGLPVVSTEGDSFADWIRENGTGAVVPYEDVAAIAAAISTFMTDGAARERAAAAVKRSQPQFTWEAALAPLVEYCSAPWRAADLAVRPRNQGGMDGARALITWRSLGLTPPASGFARVLWYTRHEGLRPMSRRALRRLRSIYRRYFPHRA